MSDMDEGDTPYEGLFCTCGLKACDAAWQAGRNKGCPECKAPWPASLKKRYPYSGKPEIRSFKPSSVELLAQASPNPDDETRVVGQHRVKSHSPAHSAAVRLLEEEDRVRGAERFEDQARQVRMRAIAAKDMAWKDLQAAEGYVRYVGKA